MNTMNIFLPDALESFADHQVSQHGYGTSSEHVRELICKDHDHQQLRGLLLAGVDSAPSAPADTAYFSALRARVTQQTRR
ncbi:MAG: type II toxin-antitoxin system ParD family antitoxin [Azonexus sp.]|jgi:antitoxin ParD1/3/4|nr:type II toxin-antitoxin system ParD family antitoxin [Azonexus sp.]